MVVCLVEAPKIQEAPYAVIYNPCSDGVGETMEIWVPEPRDSPHAMRVLKLGGVLFRQRI